MSTTNELYEKKIKIDFSGYRISIDQTTVAAYSRTGVDSIPLAKSPIGDPTSTSIYYIPPLTRTGSGTMVSRKERYPSLSSPFIRATEVVAARLGEETMSDELVEKVKRLTEDLKDANKKPLHVDDLSYMPRTDLKTAKSIAQILKSCYVDFIIGDVLDQALDQAAAIYADFFPDTTDFQTDLDSVYQVDINLFCGMLKEGRVTEVGIRIIGNDGVQQAAHSTNSAYGLEPIAIWCPRYSKAFLDIVSGSSKITYALLGYFDRVTGIPAFDVIRVNNDKHLWLSSGSNVAICSLKSLISDVLSHSYDEMLLQYLKQYQRVPVATTPTDDFDIENALASDLQDGVRYVALSLDASEVWVSSFI